MDYLSIYRKLVEKSNEEKVIAILKETGNWETLKALHLEIIENKTLSYIFITADYQHDVGGCYAAAMIGVYLEKRFITEIDEEYNHDYFYLPVIIKPDKLPEIAKKYYSEEIAVKHELIHVADMLQWINDDPEYIEKAIEYCYESATEENIEKSIDFEVKKIFRLEPQAMGNDFDSGEDMIIEPFLFGVYMKYTCKSRAEYIKIKVADYIINLQTMYEKNFSDKKKSVEQFFQKSVMKYGKKIFGNAPYNKLKKVKRDKVEKLLKFNSPLPRPLPRPLPETERGVSPFPFREGGRGVR